MKTGQFAKWTSTEDGKPFVYVGKIVSLAKGRVAMATVDGEMSFLMTDGELVSAKKPTEFDQRVAARTARIEKAARKPAVARKPKAQKRVAGQSKLDRARVLLRGRIVANSTPVNVDRVHGLVRKEAIALLCEELDMTPAGASTYFAKIKKELVA